jgi:hypothetical protein
MVLGYFEMPDEGEIPPQEMWGDDDALMRWFEDVKVRRQNPGSGPMETIPDMQENELTKQLGL